MGLPGLLGGAVADRIAQAIANPGDDRGAPPTRAPVIIAGKGGERDQQLDDEAVDENDQDFPREHRRPAAVWQGLGQEHADVCPPGQPQREKRAISDLPLRRVWPIPALRAPR